jgi:hypothetical protein
MKFVPLTGFLVALVTSAAASAGKPDDRTVPPAIYTALLDCRNIAEPQQRLACFDAKAEALAAATAQHSIIITDREELRKTRRNLFGFTIPQSGLLASGDGQDDEIKRFETTVTTARRNREGEWVVVLATGGTWEQTDARELALAPKANQKVVITRGALGTFFVSIDGQTPLRMRRIQ